MECVSCENKMLLGKVPFLRYSKTFNRFFYDWRYLTLLDIKLNLFEFINFGKLMITNSQKFRQTVQKRKMIKL